MWGSNSVYNVTQAMADGLLVSQSTLLLWSQNIRTRRLRQEFCVKEMVAT